jgi:DNA-binding response OmpR family regulator
MEQPQKNKVLVIDDSLMARKLIVSYLASDRFEVYEGKDGPSGLALAPEVNPDLILLDFVMPGMNGHEVYQALRSQEQFADTPVILFSSSYDEVVRKFGHPFVGFEFLHKQATGEQILERVNALLPNQVPDPALAFDLPSVTPAKLPQPQVEISTFLDETRLQPEPAQSTPASTTSSSNAIADALASLNPASTRASSRSASQPSSNAWTWDSAETIDEQDSSKWFSATPDRERSTKERVEIDRTLSNTSQSPEQLEKLNAARDAKLDIVFQRLETLERKLNNRSSMSQSSLVFWLMGTAAIAAVIGSLMGVLVRPNPSPQTPNTSAQPALVCPYA